MSPAEILIVEDDIFVAEDLADVIRENGYHISGIASSAQKALKIIEQHKPTLILMDIELEGEVDGIELAAKIHKQYRVPIIYLTDHHDKRTIERAENIHHSYYVTKPYTRALLASQIRLVLEKEAISPTDHEALYLKEKPGSEYKVKVNYNDICYLQASGSYCEVWAKQNEEGLMKKFFVSKSMAAVVRELPKASFLQVHRSYIVNKQQVNAISKSSLDIAGELIPIGDNYKGVIKENF